MTLKSLTKTFKRIDVTDLGVFGLSSWFLAVGIWISFPFETFGPSKVVGALTDVLPELLIAGIFALTGALGITSVIKGKRRLIKDATIGLFSWSVFIAVFYSISVWRSVNVVTFISAAILSLLLFLSMNRNEP